MEETNNNYGVVKMKEWLNEKHKLINDNYLEIASAALKGEAGEGDILTYDKMFRLTQLIEEEASDFLKKFLELALHEILDLNTLVLNPKYRNSKAIVEGTRHLQCLGREIHFIIMNFNGMESKRKSHLKFLRRNLEKGRISNFPIVNFLDLPEEIRGFAQKLMSDTIYDD
jgi:hypothetical protein